MDPAKPVRVETRVRSQVKAWLQYGEELGLGPYYRDRRALEPDAAIPELAKHATNNEMFAPDMNANISSSRGLEDQNLMPPRKVVKESAAALISPAHAGTLFGEQRIEGDTLPVIREFIGDCTRCKLSKGRTKIVFGTGSPKAQLMFVGEGPGRDEDLSGEPFVGRAGKLLTDMIKAMGLQREDVYIANIVKCRPPDNRQPEQDEVAACSPFLMRQIDVIQPKVICTLGNTPTQTLMQTTQGISRFRGEWFEFRNAKLMPTYHPAYLLRNPAAKADVWKDLQKVMAVLGLQAPKKR
jgi:uracil-DNA glycosylase family 4